jgi:hypothetical protein
MKNNIIEATLSVVLFLIANIETNSQTNINFDNLNAYLGHPKNIEWYTSNWGNGFGHKIYNDDPQNGSTYLKIAGRHSSIQNGAWKDILSISSDSKVGIGDFFPAPLVGLSLQFDENPTFLGRNNSAALRICNHNTTSFSTKSEIQFGVNENFNTNLAAIAVEYVASNAYVGGDLIFGTSPETLPDVIERMRITHDGDVLVRDNNGVVNFKIKSTGFTYCRELNVMTGNFPDYVFSKSHKLISIKDLDAFIQINSRLPGFEQADHYIQKGLKVSEMLVKQQEKIEELTLYIIALEKRLSKLESQKSKI